MNLITSLCQLAAGGRAVVTTIHQPSSRLYQQLDKLLLLSEGHAMYYGETPACLSTYTGSYPPCIAFPGPPRRKYLLWTHLAFPTL